MGMQAEEFVWRLPPKVGDDPDGDGVKRELSVGDITAMAIYNAAQEAPTDLAHVAELGYAAAPDATAKGQIDRGRQLFTQVGCVTCHVPEMRLANTVFEEPTKRGAGQYLDTFLAGRIPTMTRLTRRASTCSRIPRRRGSRPIRRAARSFGCTAT